MWLNITAPSLVTWFIDTDEDQKTAAPSLLEMPAEKRKFWSTDS